MVVVLGPFLFGRQSAFFFHGLHLPRLPLLVRFVLSSRSQILEIGGLFLLLLAVGVLFDLLLVFVAFHQVLFPAQLTLRSRSRCLESTWSTSPPPSFSLSAAASSVSWDHLGSSW